MNQATINLTSPQVAKVLGGVGGIKCGGYGWVNPAVAITNSNVGELFEGSQLPLMPDLLRIYSGYGKTQNVSIPGVGSMSPVRLDQRVFGGIRVERDIFRPDERASALIIMPGRKNEEVTIVVKVNSQQRSTETVRLNQHGISILFLNKLEMGTYTLEVSGADYISGTFIVAEITVPKLSATLLRTPVISEETDTISLVGKLLSYGEAYANKRLRFRLSEGGTPTGAIVNVTTDDEGQFSVELDLNQAREQLSLQVESIADTELICQVALIGSSATDRALTVVNNLGEVREVSMIPRTADQEDIRGLFFQNGMKTNTPISVVNNFGSNLLFETRVEIPLMLVTVYNPVADTYSEQELRGLMPSQIHDIEIPSPFALVMFAAWVREGSEYKAWFGWTSFVKDSALQLHLSHESEVQPGEKLEVQINTSQPTSVALFVYPAQLTASNSGTSTLARTMKDTMVAWSKDLTAPGIQTTPLYQPPGFGRALETFTERGGGTRRGALLGGDDAPVMRGGEAMRGGFSYGMEEALSLGLPKRGSNLEAFSYSGGVLGVPEQAAVSTAVELLVPLRAEGPLTICAMLVQVNGQEVISIAMPEEIGRYQITAYAISPNLDWASFDSSVESTKPVYVDMRRVRHLLPGDMHSVRAHVETRSGKAKVVARFDGDVLPIWVRGNVVRQGDTITTPATVEFTITGPGEVLLQVECPESGEVDAQQMIVAEPRSHRSQYQDTTILMPGSSLHLRDLPDAISMRVLPGLQGQLQKLLTAVGIYPYDCCEQTSGKLISLLANIVQGDGGSVEMFIAGYHRMVSMLRSGGVIGFYPDHGSNEHYSPMAARNLHRLTPFLSSPVIYNDARIYPMVKHLVEASKASVAHYRLYFDGSPYNASEAWDKYDIQASASFIHRRVIWDGNTYVLSSPSRDAGGTVGVRAEAAYGAAILAKVGQIQEAVKMANWVIAQFGESGRGHSTYDGVAAVFMMLELHKLGIGDALAKVEVDGDLMTLAQAVALGDIGTVKASTGAALVGYLVEKQRHWSDFQASIPVKVGLRDRRGQIATQVRAGEDVTLIVDLPEGYKPGYLVTICLPPTLAAIVGGAQVFQLTRDFEGKNRVEIALKALGKTINHQRVAVLVTSMYDDTIAGNPEPFSVTIM